MVKLDVTSVKNMQQRPKPEKNIFKILWFKILNAIKLKIVDNFNVQIGFYTSNATFNRS